MGAYGNGSQFEMGKGRPGQEVTLLQPSRKTEKKPKLPGDGFKYILFSPLPGEMIKFDDHIFSDGLVQPPTSLPFCSWTLRFVWFFSLPKVVRLR